MKEQKATTDQSHEIFFRKKKSHIKVLVIEDTTNTVRNQPNLILKYHLKEKWIFNSEKAF